MVYLEYFKNKFEKIIKFCPIVNLDILTVTMHSYYCEITSFLHKFKIL